MASTYNMRAKPSEVVVACTNAVAARAAVVGAAEACGGSVPYDVALGFDAGDGALAWLTRARSSDREVAQRALREAAGAAGAGCSAGLERPASAAARPHPPASVRVPLRAGSPALSPAPSPAAPPASLPKPKTEKPRSRRPSRLF